LLALKWALLDEEEPSANRSTENQHGGARANSKDEPRESTKTLAVSYDSLVVLVSEQDSNPSLINQLISTFRCSHSHPNIPDNIF